MKSISTLFYFVIFCVFFTLFSFHPASLHGHDHSNEKEVEFNLELFSDQTGKLDFGNVLDQEFESVKEEVPNLGVTDWNHWVRIVPETDLNSEDLYLVLSYPGIDEVEFFQVTDNRITQYNWVQMSEPYSKREFQHQDYVFRVGDSEVSQIYLRVKSAKQILLPIKFLNSNQLSQSSLGKDILFGMYSGLMLVMLIYNLFIWYSMREKSYVALLGYIVALYFTHTHFQGYGLRFFYPEFPTFSLNAVYLFSSLVGITAILFAKKFLDIKENLPWASQILNGFIILYISSLLVAICGLQVMAYKMLQVVAGTVALFVLYVTIVLLRQGVRQARFYLLASAFVIAGVIIFVLKDIGILAYNIFTYNSMAIGSAIEVTLLSIALADKINTLKREKEESQVAVVEALRQNETIVREQNVMLEQKVGERTRELEHSNTELNKTLSNLKNTQAQLIDAEKMASLGQMTAGIAHELNNPINFVSSNVNPLKRDIGDLFEVIDKYNAVNGENRDAAMQEVQDLMDKLDIDYVKKEIQELLDGIHEGAARTTEIVRGLRVFSRLDENSLKKASINDCINSTAIVLKSNMKNLCTLKRELDESLPEINCFPGRLNQVFMNIMNNAVQAVSRLDKPKEERFVTVRTWQDEHNVFVSIKDNGVGMTPEVKSKIFDPFYTTKNVGEGTGLGLAIVKGIIEDHSGEIIVESESGKGTEFIITLPKNL